MLDWKNEWKPLLVITAVFLGFYHLPLEHSVVGAAVMESLYLAREYARDHVLLCLVPAFFIAGAIAVFLSKASVMKYLGATANKVLAYGVASVSGSILAVCSCTVLPLFAGIYRMGAGLGPASSFLYAGPAINILAIILTARVLGLEMGVARAVGAIAFSIVIGLLMHLIFRREELDKAHAQLEEPSVEPSRPLWQTSVHFMLMVGILVFANWGAPEAHSGLWHGIYSAKWVITSIFAILFGITLVVMFGLQWWKVTIASIAPIVLAALFPWSPMLSFAGGVVALSVVLNREKGEMGEWFSSTWGFARQILPLLFIGVLVAGALLGRPGSEGLVPADWISRAVGGNSFRANLFASVVGAFMYFATLTEVPILQGLIGNGMGKGPALTLLLAGPALSLPNMLVIRSIMGTRKTVAYVVLVIIMATVSGMIYGTL